MHERSVCLWMTMAFLVAAGSAPTQEAIAPPWPMTVPREAYERLGTAGYLEAVLGLLDREEEALASEDTRTTYLDLLGAQLALVGEEERATRCGDRAFPRVQPGAPSSEAEHSLLHSYRPTPAVEAIVEAARERRLVMVNEEHRSSRQRALTHLLLAPLRELGFTHLALETLSEDPTTLRARGHPVLDSGTYTDDPVFGDLVRRALDLGYVVFGYEAGPDDLAPRPDDASPADRMNRRELAQARNIFERSFEVDADARVLVHAGRDHIAEGAGMWTPMGSLLAEISGVDPLSVNLFVMAEHSLPEYEPWAFKAVDGAGWLGGGPVLLVAGDGEFWTASPGSLDAYVFVPRTRIERGRPHWMSMGGLRSPLEVEAPAAEEPRLIQALVEGETADAIPFDHAIWWPGEAAPALFLRPGAYVVRVIDRGGVEHHRERVRVP